MTILRLADLPSGPWKNGGGTTTEIAVFPAGAALDDFDWRVSRAHVGRDGAFSCFPGIDRTLAVVAGTGMDLVFDDRRVRVDPASGPHSFPGDVAVEGRLVDGPIDDLNVMTRSGRFAHRMIRLRLDAPRTLGVEGTGPDDRRLVVALTPLAITVDTATDRLAPGDVVMLAAGGAARLTPATDLGEVLVIDVTAIRHG